MYFQVIADNEIDTQIPQTLRDTAKTAATTTTNKNNDIIIQF